jgi:tRNA dimethylallyltransferase
MNRLTVIVGPTASGKSAAAVRLAVQLGAPILSTDSRQVYRGMAIGTAQPTPEELAAVTHYFIADREPTERFTCADFEREALALLDELFKTHPHVVAVGGSGLYVDALCRGLDPLPDIDPALRAELTAMRQREGLAPLLEMLRERDPAYYEKVDRQNPARVQRAVEVCLSTGRPFSELRTGRSTPRPFEIVKIGIDLPRPELYARIDARVDEMMAQGLEAEARALHPLKHLPALQTVGYSELFDHFDSLYTSPDGEPLSPEQSLARAVELIKRNSRRYAKRQLTWFRRDPSILWNPEI